MSLAHQEKAVLIWACQVGLWHKVRHTPANVSSRIVRTVYPVKESYQDPDDEIVPLSLLSIVWEKQAARCRPGSAFSVPQGAHCKTTHTGDT